MLSSPTAAASYRDDDLSSPDPLASSFHTQDISEPCSHGNRKSPSKRAGATVTKRTARRSRSASFDHGAISSSPFRTVSEQNLSPWKIRVTVEAEPEDTEMDGPVTRTMTRTVKVPLRSESSPLEAPRSSRARKSQSSPSKSRRSVTPVRGQRNSSRARRPSVTDLDVRPLGDDADSDDWAKQKKSPRKRRGTRSRKSTPSADAEATPEPSSARGARTRSSLADFDIRQDTDAEERDPSAEPVIASSPQSNSPELRQMDLNRVSIRSRATATKFTAAANQDGLALDKPLPNPRIKPVEVRKVSVNSAISYPTPSPTSSYHGDSDGIGIGGDGHPGAAMDPVGLDTVLESEGFTMIDLDTLPSARRYLSPIEDGPNEHSATTDQISSNAQSYSMPEENQSEFEHPDIAEHPAEPLPEIDYPTLNVDETDISSTVPSSPPSSAKEKSLLQIPSSHHRKVTPMTLSSPKLPSPPKQMARRTPQHQHRGSAGAMFAGIALQDVVSPDHPSDKSAARGRVTPVSRNSEDDHLFQGFDARTKRELRAGLRFGEELASRQSSSSQIHSEAKSLRSELSSKSSVLQISGNEGFYPATDRHQQPQTQVWRGETTVQRTPIQILTATGAKETTFGNPLVHTPQNPVSRKREQTILDTQARREREWQLEREAVSRQIQNASESQVIVIDSDDDEEVAQPAPSDHASADHHLNVALAPEPIADYADEDEDIWLAEAKNSSSPEAPHQIPQASEPDPFTQHEQMQQREAAVQALSRPRRSLIPSPWKRGDDVPAPPEHSTFLSTNLDEQSGVLFWNAPTDIKFGAKEAQRQQLRPRSGSGKFDVELMIGTPGKQQTEDSRLDLTRTPVQNDHEGDFHRQDESEVLEQSITSSTQGDRHQHDVINETLGEPDAISSPQQLPRVPVKLDESTIEVATPPQTRNRHRSTSSRSACPEDEAAAPAYSSPPRPPTPRSAMKGARQSFAGEFGFEQPADPLMVRRVIWSERSRGVDIHGLESSFSMKSASDDSVAGALQDQLVRELQANEDESAIREEDEVVPEADEMSETEIEESQDDTPTQADLIAERPEPSKGWRAWLWGSKNNSSTDASDISQDDATVHPGPLSATNPHLSKNEEKTEQFAWTQTKSSIPSGPLHRTVSAVPSYLLAPSYPSDPTRSTKTPLATTGAFTNTHFRTLHIIYRKSLRPKFHPPRQIRACVRQLQGTQLEIDETAHGIDRGVMTWTIGEGECEVLERFMQEVEFGYGVVPASDPRGSSTAATRAADNTVVWGWSVDQLATWLCRIVVGEIVREEEVKARVKSAKGRDGKQAKA